MIIRCIMFTAIICCMFVSCDKIKNYVGIKTYVYEVKIEEINGSEYVTKDGNVFSGIIYSSNELISATFSNGKCIQETVYNDHGDEICSVSLTSSGYVYKKDGKLYMSKKEFLRNEKSLEKALDGPSYKTAERELGKIDNIY